jgi:hypothetical protein
MLETGGGFGVMRGKDNEGFFVGGGLDGGIGLAREAVTRRVGGEFVIEPLLLGVADIRGEEDVMGVSFDEKGEEGGAEPGGI